MQTVTDIINQYNNGESLDFIGFFGPNHPFSNFHPAHFEIGGNKFSCSEQYFMYRKAILFGDNTNAQRILNAYGAHPKVFKALGRQVKGFTLSKWYKHRDGIMYDALYHKFTQNEDLLKKLVDTKQAVLVETSPFDAIWGIKLGKHTRQGRKPTGWKNPSNWNGENRLGFLLMDLRDIVTPSVEQSA